MRMVNVYVMTTPIHHIFVRSTFQMNKAPESISSNLLPGKFAENHLDVCTHTECQFCSNQQCCFGMRDIGCPKLDPELLHRTGHISSIVKAAYMAGFYDPRDIREIREGVKDLIMSTKEVSA